MAKQSTNSRQSKAAQYHAKIDAAYRSATYVGKAPYNDLYDVYSVASQSQAETRYTVTVDLVSGHSRCDCEAGQYDRRCCHVQAVERVMHERATLINQAVTGAANAAQADAIMDEVADMTATYVRIGETCGWDDSRLPALDADIARYTAQAEAIRANGGNAHGATQQRNTQASVA